MREIDMPISVNGLNNHCLKIRFMSVVQHTTNRYWWELYTFGKGEKLREGEFEFDSNKGTVALVAEVFRRMK